MRLKRNQKFIPIIGIILVFFMIGAFSFVKGENIASPNAEYSLKTTSAYGDNEGYHPKVISFDTEWNGYKYWMAFTPYPKADESKENPHILASNDMISWEEPDGFENPLQSNNEYVNEKNKKKYNSDTALLYRDDMNRLECFWRYVNEESGKVVIYRRCSNDGVNWDEKEKVLEVNKKDEDCISPAIIFDENIYKMWYVDNGYVVKYRESSDGLNWGEPRLIHIQYDNNSIGVKDIKNWHLDVIKTDYGYEMLMSAFEKGTSRNEMDLYYTKSKDNISWEKCSVILKHSDNPEAWDNRGIYKSTFLYKDGVYYVFYSGIAKNEIRGIGLTFGKDIYKLQGLSDENKNEFLKLISK